MARTISLTKYEFDSLFYPSIANGSAENETELEVALRVVRKITNDTQTVEEVITAERRAEAKRMGIKLVPQREALNDPVIFTFEEDEYRMIMDRMVKAIPRYTLAVAPQLHGLIKGIKEAKQDEA